MTSKVLGVLIPTAGPSGSTAIALLDAFAHLEHSLSHLPRTAAAVHRTVLLAVSGGPDSLALLRSVAHHSDALKSLGYGFQVVTVDHGLRAGSAGEAAHVADIARAFGLRHETRRWKGEKPSANLQAAAREARYGLLTDAAFDIGAVAVMTAHHLDDQIETHLLAAARHAGDRGLAGMRPARCLFPGVLLLRPFLGISAAHLRQLSGHLAAIDDPSNRDERFDRVRLRLRLADGEIDRMAVLAAIRLHAERRDAADLRLAAVVSDALRKDRLLVDEAGTVRLEAAVLGGLDEDAATDLLSRILRAVSGRLYPPARDQTLRLLRRLEALAPNGEAMTLGGVVVQPGATMGFSREYGRAGPAAVEVPSLPQRLSFDGRFLIDPWTSCKDGSLEGARLVPMGRLGRGSTAERTLPVLLDDAGRPLVAPPALLAKLPAGTRPLPMRELVSWRCLADLPVDPDLAAG